MAKKAAKKKVARKAAKKVEKSFEEALWDSATRLRGSVESSEYKHVVLSLIFLKFVSDKFVERQVELLEEGQGDYVDMVAFYTMKNVFYLPETSRWSYIKQHAKQDDIAIKIDSALAAVEKSNTSLKGALPDNYFSRLGLDGSKLSALIDAINNIDIPFETKMTELSQTLYKQMEESARLDEVICNNLKGLGYGKKLGSGACL